MGNIIDINDVLTIEQGTEDPLEYYLAIQRSINSGQGWLLQGSYGRAMMSAIEQGLCMLGPTSNRDYWGSTIPARGDVKPGTKGSREFVVRMAGNEWAKAMEEA